MKILPEGISWKAITFIIMLMIFQVVGFPLIASGRVEGWLAGLLGTLLALSAILTFTIWVAFGLFVLLPLVLIGTGVWLVTLGTPIGIGIGVALFVLIAITVSIIIWMYYFNKRRL